MEQAEALEWVERVAKYTADQDGLPLIAGRVLGWLVICDPPEQSAGQIADAIGASRASLTTNLRLLGSVGFLTEVTRPGERTVYYRIDDEAWARVVERQITSLARFGRIMADGLDLVGPESERAGRMRSAREVFAWMEKVFTDAPPLRTGRTDKERDGT